MVTIKVKFFSIIADTARSKEVELNFNSSEVKLKDVINYLMCRYPKLKRLSKEINILYLINGKVISNVNISIKDNDEVALIPPASGG